MGRSHYAPKPGFTGLDGFQYRATDGFLTSDVTQVVLAVTPEIQVSTPLIPDRNRSSPTLQVIDDSYSTLASDGLVVFGGDVGISGDKGILYEEESIRRNDFPRERSGDAFDLDFVSDASVIVGLGMSTTDLGYDAYYFLALPTIVGGRTQFFGECFTGTRYYSYAYLVDSELGQGLSNIGMVTLRSHDSDSDGDEVFDTEEGLCEPLASNGDDSFRDPSTHDDASVATIENAVDGRRLIVDVSAGSFREATSETVPTVGPPPANIDFPVGIIGFDIHDLPPNGQTTVSLTLPEGVEVNSYWKFGRESDNPLTIFVDESAEPPHWWNFAFDPSTQTGAQFYGNLVTLHFVDGERGDDDLTVNGVIVEPGGPARVVERLTADFNADGRVDAVDIDLLFEAITSGELGALFDLNKDDDVNDGDLDFLLESLLNTRRGDANLDQKVDFADFLILAERFGSNVESWSLGDFDGDGTVAFTDFILLADEFGFDATNDSTKGAKCECGSPQRSI